MYPMTNGQSSRVTHEDVLRAYELNTSLSHVNQRRTYLSLNVSKQRLVLVIAVMTKLECALDARFLYPSLLQTIESSWLFSSFLRVRIP